MTIALPRYSAHESVAAVETHITEFFASKAASAERYGSLYGELWAAARRSSDGGKKFRPSLVVNAYQCLGGDSEDHVVAVATAFELLHTAFLLHDDVIDGDTVRRGRPNLIGAFSDDASRLGASKRAAATWGEASAILAGDLLIHAAQSEIARLNCPDATRLALLDLLEECVFVTAAGELADVAFATGVRSPALSQVLSMTQWKTARYSFQAPLQAGAILAGASEGTLSALGEYGASIGVAFQLRDDILGVFGAPEATGKSAINDLREGKITALMCYALQIDDTSDLRRIIGLGEVSESDAHGVREILERLGARQYIEYLIEERALHAVSALDSPAIPRSLRAQLTDVAHQARERSS